MKHKEIYSYLLVEQHFDQIKTLMKDQKIYESLGVQEVILEMDNQFPYILLKIVTDQVVAAQMIGVFINIESLLPEYTDSYYLPVIAIGINYELKYRKLINLQNTIEHELLHIKDVLFLIENDPTYYDRLMKYTLIQQENNEYLKESIDLEVFKIFNLEPQACGSDFDKGEKVIRVEFQGIMHEYECKTKQEYVEMQLVSYLNNILKICYDKFPEKRNEIHDYLQSSITKHGKNVYGLTPMTGFKKACEIYLVIGKKGTKIKDVNTKSNIKYKQNGFKIGRNAPCPCGSGRKYKKCCLNK